MIALVILKIVLIQVVVIAFIIFALKKILDRQLIEFAVHKVELTPAEELGAGLKEVIIITADGKFQELSQKKILHAISKKLNRVVALNIQQDKTIRGGAIIKVNKTVIDCSLTSRLKESGLLR
ncbi:MAG: F0F1 ATP synthase subunit delta [Candidatus Omnitrophota bacterium]